MNPRIVLLSAIAVSAAGGLAIQLGRTSRSTPDILAPGIVSTNRSTAKAAEFSTPVNSSRFVQETEESPVPGEPASALEVHQASSLPIRSNMEAGPRVFAPVSEQELRARAAIVEQEANHDLKHLVGLLDLSEAQQDRIFDTLVRHSPDWHPAMQAAGSAYSAAKTAEIHASAARGSGTDGPPTGKTGLLDGIAAELTPDQLVQFADSELDREEWWGAILDQLEEALPVGTSISGTAGAAPPMPEASAPLVDKTGGEPAVLAE